MVHNNTLTLSLLQQIDQYFTESHQQAFLVGGSVRDLLMAETVIVTRDAIEHIEEAFA